jgi:hypothetical protein
MPTIYIESTSRGTGEGSSPENACDPSYARKNARDGDTLQFCDIPAMMMYKDMVARGVFEYPGNSDDKLPKGPDGRIIFPEVSR